MVATRYNIKDKKFYATHGGTITSYDGGIKGVTEFNSAMNTEVGKAYSLSIGWDGDKMQASNNGSTIAFTRLDDGVKGLAGNWRITQREQNGKLTPIHTTGPRKNDQDALIYPISMGGNQYRNRRVFRHRWRQI
jgi:hypothetical protein